MVDYGRYRKIEHQNEAYAQSDAGLLYYAIDAVY